jgi:hypothetical protein
MEQMAPELLQLYSCLGYYTAAIANYKATIDKHSREEFEKIFSKQNFP